VAGADELAGADAGELVVGEDDGLEVPLLPQAATPIPSAHARIIRSDLLLPITTILPTPHRSLVPRAQVDSQLISRHIAERATK
jgi:hypothetical protein